MTAEQEESIRKKLYEHRDLVLRDFELQRNSDRNENGDELEDPLDRTELELERAFEHRREHDDVHLLRKINHALKRLEEGSFEVCERCQSIIPWDRLEARPFVSLCLTCQQDKEDGKMVERPR